MGVRAALGASRARLLRHIAVETLVVAALGGCLGLLQNGWLIDVSRFILPAQVTTAELNSRVVVFALSLMLFASFVCAIFPAGHVVRRDFSAVLGSSNRTAGYRPSQRRAYRALVAAELAITFVMMLGTGLLANSWRLLPLSPGSPRVAHRDSIRLPR
jgi:predicted lysophospholipase L1 biosynthesis ABC-type transport system permease subunit